MKLTKLSVYLASIGHCACSVFSVKHGHIGALAY